MEEDELLHRCWAILKKYFQILVEQMEAQKPITAKTHQGYIAREENQHAWIK